MPNVNIPPKVRLALYLLAAVALLVVSYAVAKGWAGDAEVALVTGLAALANVLAAAKTDTSGAHEDGGPGMGAGVDPAQPVDVE